jgi:LAS superfamily LD-carboxypeptidase LdcB
MVEGTYTDFIKSIKTIEFGGFNGIEYSDGGFEPYISFQALLKWVGEYPNLFSAKFPIIKVDYESDKPLFMYSTSVSCDLSKCYIRNDYLKTTLGTFNPSIAPSFKNINTFTDGNYGGLNSTLKEEAGVIEDISMYPQIGNINFIYLSVTYLSELILKQSDNSNNKVTVGTFLQKVCDGVNKSLGSINDLQVITDVDGTAETLTIVDYQQKRIKGLPDIRKEEKRTITTIQAQGLGSMLTSIQAQSSITPELASTISIGAQAQSQPVGEEATSFSRLSRGLTDRVYPAKVQGDSEAALKREEDRKKAVESKFKQAISSYSKFIKNQIPQPGDSYSPVLLKSTDTTNISNIAVELYKSCLAMFTDTKQTSTAFIPIKLDISLYGIAGTKIYQKFKLSNDVLPLSYQGDYEFIILGVSHTVNSAKWETSISSLISLKDEKIKESGPDKPFSVKLSELDVTTESSASTGGANSSIRSTVRKGPITVNGQVVTVTNGEVPDEYMTELSNSAIYKGAIQSDKGRIRLLTPVMQELEKLLAHYKRDYPRTPMKINSAFRTYNDQVIVRRYWVNKGKPGNAAYPGRSNHGFGRAVDFANVNLSKLTPSMVQYKWLKKNAGTYGFTRIYKPGKSETWEAWHWEYLGEVKL